MFVEGKPRTVFFLQTLYLQYLSRRLKKSNIRAGRTWSWVSSGWENAKRNVEPCWDHGGGWGYFFTGVSTILNWKGGRIIQNQIKNEICCLKWIQGPIIIRPAWKLWRGRRRVLRSLFPGMRGTARRDTGSHHHQQHHQHHSHYILIKIY